MSKYLCIIRNAFCMRSKVYITFNHTSCGNTIKHCYIIYSAITNQVFISLSSRPYCIIYRNSESRNCINANFINIFWIFHINIHFNFRMNCSGSYRFYNNFFPASVINLSKIFCSTNNRNDRTFIGYFHKFIR